VEPNIKKKEFVEPNIKKEEPNIKKKESTEPTSHLFLGNIEQHITENDVIVFCTQFGDTLSCNLRKGPKHSFAFVNFKSVNEAKLAKEGIEEGHTLGTLLPQVSFKECNRVGSCLSCATK